MMTLSRLGGTMEMQRWNRPYPKLTAPRSRLSVSSDTPSAAVWLWLAASAGEGVPAGRRWCSSCSALMSR